ncbi:hypothetical protein H2203_003761 [Taxawa tesnikishii (nom. ined.)]|nr:hypothetical protein H2203_003761 [Dothideales sp. JES 119]
MAPITQNNTAEIRKLKAIAERYSGLPQAQRTSDQRLSALESSFKTLKSGTQMHDETIMRLEDAVRRFEFDTLPAVRSALDQRLDAVAAFAASGLSTTAVRSQSHTQGIEDLDCFRWRITKRVDDLEEILGRQQSVRLRRRHSEERAADDSLHAASPDKLVSALIHRLHRGDSTSNSMAHELLQALSVSSSTTTSRTGKSKRQEVKADAEKIHQEARLLEARSPLAQHIHLQEHDSYYSSIPEGSEADESQAPGLRMAWAHEGTMADCMGEDQHNDQDEEPDHWEEQQFATPFPHAEDSLFPLDTETRIASKAAFELLRQFGNGFSSPHSNFGRYEASTPNGYTAVDNTEEDLAEEPQDSFFSESSRSLYDHSERASNGGGTAGRI